MLLFLNSYWPACTIFPFLEHCTFLAWAKGETGKNSIAANHVKEFCIHLDFFCLRSSSCNSPQVSRGMALMGDWTMTKLRIKISFKDFFKSRSKNFFGSYSCHTISLKAIEGGDDFLLTLKSRKLKTVSELEWLQQNMTEKKDVFVKLKLSKYWK